MSRGGRQRALSTASPVAELRHIAALQQMLGANG